MNKRSFMRTLAILLSVLMMLTIMPIMQVAAAPTDITDVLVSQEVPTGGYTPMDLASYYNVDLGYSASKDVTKDYYVFIGEGAPSLENETDWALMGNYEPFVAGETYACVFNVTLTDSAYEFTGEVNVTSAQTTNVLRTYVDPVELQFVVMYDPALGFSADSYYLSVGDVEVTPANAADIFGNGTASYDPETSTLTLKNATIKAGWSPFADELVGIYALKPLVIEVEGNNVIDLSALDAATVNWASGIFSEDRLIIFGDGDLTVNASDAGESSHGIYAFGELTLNPGGNWSINSGAAMSTSTGIYAPEGLILEATKVGATFGVTGRYQGIYTTSFNAYDFDATAAADYGGLLKAVEWATFESNFNAYRSIKLTAIEPTTYNVLVAGVPVTDLNKNNVLGDGKVKYDPSAKKLTLTNATLTKTDTFSSSYYYGTNYAVIYAAQPISIELVGDNVIDTTGVTFGPANNVFNIIGDSPRLSIGGEGNLTIKAGAAGVQQYGICGTGNVDISMKGDLTISCEKDETFTGIHADDGYLDMYMEGKWTVDTGESNTTDWTTALYAYKDMSIYNGGTATLTAGNRPNYCADAIYVSDGNLNLINKGTMTVSVGDTGSGDAEVIYADDNASILNDGKLTVTAGDAPSDDSFGIFTSDGYLYLINNGTATVTTGDAYGYSVPIWSFYLVEASGKGTLTATAGDAKFSTAIVAFEYSSEVILEGNGTYIINSGTASDWGAGVYGGIVSFEDDVTVTVNAEKNTNKDLIGVQADNFLYIATSGDVTVTAGKAGDTSYGISGVNGIYLLGDGDVNVTAGKGTGGSFGAWGDEVIVAGTGNVSLVADDSSDPSYGISASSISFSNTNLDNKIYVEGATQAMNVMPTFDADFYSTKGSETLPASLETIALNLTTFNTFKAIELTSLVKTVEDKPAAVIGDADGDGEVTMKDVLLARKFIAKLIGEADLDTAAADADGDGFVTMKDVLLMRKAVAKLVTL